MNSDDRFDLQMPKPWQPNFFDWEKQTLVEVGEQITTEIEGIEYEGASRLRMERYISPLEKNKVVDIVSWPDLNSTVVIYQLSVDGMLIKHRIGGPAYYLYEHDIGRMTRLSFYLFDKKFKEREYWKQLMQSCEFYDYENLKVWYPHPDGVEESGKLRYYYHYLKSNPKKRKKLSRCKYYKIMEEEFKGF